MVHGKCSKQLKFQSIQGRVPQYYTCGSCLFNELPFKNSNLQNLDKSINLEDSTECQHKVIIENNSKNLSIVHLNTHHCVLHLTMFQCFDIKTLSETWLKNNKHMLECVQIEGYKSEFINTEGRRGGGVGVYIKDCFRYKIPKDIVDFEPDIGHILIDLTYRNKNSSVMVGAFYQNSFNNTSKTEWLGKFSAIIGQVLIKLG